MSTRDYTIVCLSETLSPATHMARAEGNESIVAREPVVTPRGVRWVPMLSGNAIRHRCVRAPGARWLVAEYGLAGSLTLPQLNFLFHGGSLTEGGGRENTARIADMQRLFPLVRLVGGCLPDQILAGSLQVWRGSLVCEENRAYLEAVLPDPSALPGRLRPAEAFVSGYQYTRGDARKSSGVAPVVEVRAGRDASVILDEEAIYRSLACRPGVRLHIERLLGGGDADPSAVVRMDLEDGLFLAGWLKHHSPDGRRDLLRIDGLPREESNLMIFAGQAVTRGAAFLHGFSLPHVGQVELGALLWSLRLWQSAGGTVGGQAARGHGRLGTSLLDGDLGAEEAVAAYLDHARAVKDDAVAWLHGVFAPRAEKPARGKTKGKPKVADGTEPAPLLVGED